MSDHVMETETTLPHGWMVQCPECPRRIWFPRDGSLEVQDRGDFNALHAWSSHQGLALAAAIGDTE